MQEKREIINSGYYYIKPAANHILTVGKGIIKDSYTAILELVKNAYDADAEEVRIKLKFDKKGSNISIQDNGHGMSFEIVTQKWMVPSTQVKLRQRKSRFKKRPLQGRKGIGRYAASILGNDLLMKTTDCETLITTELLLDWNEFATDSKFLEDIDILIESYKSSINELGTFLNITGNSVWSDSDLDELISSLKRLLSPFDEIDNDFKIFIEIQKESSEKYVDYSEQIKPLPILEYYHYRIFGTIDFLEINEQKNEVLTAKLTIENKSLSNILPINIDKKIILRDGEKFCGLLELDIRAFDLDEEIKNISTIEAKKQLKDLPGVAVIKEGFRVRPYGDKKVDWLGLNERRYNNPTLRLSSNQVAGYVTVLQEEDSHLEEKASREGFKENEYYEGLIQSVLSCLSELEPIRYKFRKQHNKGGRKPKNINQQIDEATNFDNLNNKITSMLTTAKVPDAVSNEVKKIIEQEAKEKSEQFEEIKKTIARYQGQVTLGKIMTVVFHEGRKPLNALKQHPKFITEWTKEFFLLFNGNTADKKEELEKLYGKILDRLNDNKQQAEIFINIFKKLEPLANNKRSAQKEFTISKPIEDSFKLFENELTEKNISYNITGDLDVKLKGWEIDIQIAFANLIENSIYWLSETNDKFIAIDIKEEEDQIIIDYQDNGLGIDEENIQNQDIFDPGFSTKSDGTGLGLSIAGEALERNRGKIEAVSSSLGANFIIKLNK
ncbi:MAG: sensor histidine kinase [Chitinophagales bacterium]|nr:sensor histidine kinase [Chitinophagales bacterium]